MRYHFPFLTGTGWAICYRNWRDDIVPIMECCTFEAAHREAEKATRASFTEFVQSQLIAQQITGKATV